MRVFFRLFVIAIILIALSEIFVRFVLILPVSTTPDKELVWAYKPYSTIFHTSEGRAINKMNSMGFNDSDPSSEKKHILVLGDSFTEALQVSRIENFTSIAELMSPCLDIYNVGRSGLSPIHYPALLSKVTMSVDSKLAVIVITSGDLSDIRKSDFKITRDKTDNHIIDINLKQIPQSTLRRKFDPVLSNSALATYLINRVRALLSNKNSKAIKEDNTKPVAAFDDRNEIYDILLYLFRSMDNKTPIAILFHPKMEYGTNRIASVGEHSDEFEQLIKDVAYTVGIPFLSTKDHMKASYSENGQPGVGFSNKNILHGHLNPLGHRATAQALHDLISKTGMKCSHLDEL